MKPRSKKFKQFLKSKKFSDEDMLQLSYHMLILANEKLKEHMIDLLDENEVRKLNMLKSQEETISYLQTLYTAKTGGNMDTLMNTIFEEIEQTIMEFSDDIHQLFGK